MIKGVLFDKDGTLIDFNKTWLDPYFEAAKMVAASVGKPDIAATLMKEGGYDAANNKWQPDSLLASGSNDQIFAFWSEQVGRPLSEQEIAKLRSIFSKVSNHYVSAIDDLSGFLKRLRESGLCLGLATMDDERQAYSLLDKFEIREFFNFVCGADSGFGVKPAPGMVEAFCAQCGLTPDEIVMVGDSPKDLNMGKNANVAMSIGVLTGAHDREELEKFSEVVLNDIGELEPYLEKY